MRRYRCAVDPPEMPYRHPHVAGPALWALRDSLGCEFEVSVAPLQGGSSSMRRAWEAVANRISVLSWKRISSRPTCLLPAQLRMLSSSADRP